MQAVDIAQNSTVEVEKKINSTIVDTVTTTLQTIPFCPTVMSHILPFWPVDHISSGDPIRL